jgi:Domain of unknown function (DUF4280)
MSGNSITTTATLQCPHGGTVQIISANTRVKADGAFMATATDTFTVSGCPFQLPTTPPTPSPCITVKWIVTDTRVKANNAQTLSKSSSGICQSAAQLPQGPPMIVNTQTKAQSQ